MKKIRINTAVIMSDIRQRMRLQVLMEKHSLSYQNMLKVRNLLLRRGYATQEDLQYLDLAEAVSGHSVSANEFLESFKKRSDDSYLMEHFKLTIKELKTVYDVLLLAGLLSEYEYYSRDGKSPELEESMAAGYDESTEVTLLKTELEMHYTIPQKCGDIEFNKSSCSSVRQKTSSAEISQVDYSSDDLIPPHCPKCGLASHPSSPEACVYCGVIFQKAITDTM